MVQLLLLRGGIEPNPGPEVPTPTLASLAAAIAAINAQLSRPRDETSPRSVARYARRAEARSRSAHRSAPDTALCPQTLYSRETTTNVLTFRGFGETVETQQPIDQSLSHPKRGRKVAPSSRIEHKFMNMNIFRLVPHPLQHSHRRRT